MAVAADVHGVVTTALTIAPPVPSCTVCSKSNPANWSESVTVTFPTVEVSDAAVAALPDPW